MSEQFRMSVEGAEEIAKALGRFKSKTPEVVRRAVNNTAKKMQKKMHKKARELYTVKAGRFRSDALILKKANKQNLTAVLHSEGEPVQLAVFKTVPSLPPISADDREQIWAKVYKKGSLKRLSLKAFINKGKKSKRTFIAEREERTAYPLHILFSLSTPQMIGNEELVFYTIAPDIHNTYSDELSKELKRMIYLIGSGKYT